MKKYIYILLTFCLLISCMEDPTAGVVVPKYTPSTENPGGPGEEPGDGLIDPAEPLDRGFIHLKGVCTCFMGDMDLCEGNTYRKEAF